MPEVLIRSELDVFSFDSNQYSQFMPDMKWIRCG